MSKNDREILGKRLRSREAWAEAFGWMVGGGLVIEYGREIADCFVNWHRPSVALLGGVVVTAGVFGEVVFSRLVLRTSDEISKRADSDVAQANKMSTESLERSKQLERGNLTLQAEVLRLRKENEPRRLTGAQREQLAGLLKEHAGSWAVVVSVLADPESSDFADDFDAALRDAQWNTLRIRNRISSKYGVLVGPALGGFLSGESAQLGADVLSKALAAIAVPHEDVTFTEGNATIDPPFQSGCIYLVIEHKPPPTPLEK